MVTASTLRHLECGQSSVLWSLIHTPNSGLWHILQVIVVDELYYMFHFFWVWWTPILLLFDGIHGFHPCCSPHLKKLGIWFLFQVARDVGLWKVVIKNFKWQRFLPKSWLITRKVDVHQAAAAITHWLICWVFCCLQTIVPVMTFVEQFRNYVQHWIYRLFTCRRFLVLEEKNYINGG